MHKPWTVGQKLYGGLIGILLVGGALSVAGIGVIRTLDEKLEHAVNVSSRELKLVSELRTAESDMFASQGGLILYASIKRPDKLEESRVKFQKYSAQFRRTLDEIRPLLEAERARKYSDELSSVFAAWQGEFSALAGLATDGKVEEAVNFANERVIPLRAHLTSLSLEFTHLLDEQMKADAQTARQWATAGKAVVWMLILGALGVGAGGFWLVRLVSGRLRQITDALSDGAEQIASASGQVSSASQSLAQGASEQAASLEETSASTEEITSMTRKNAENSGSAAGVMEQVDQRVVDANRTLGEMVVSMQEINASSDKIARIIKVIDEIAFQTNILALNAAVEAARAGEAGMGFAVVADEVRNLAQRCAQAARDTACLIEESITKSNEGRTKLEEVALAISGITESATKVKTLVDEVNLGSQEQARGIEQIATAISQMEQVTQRTAANAEESASASEEMSSQAVVLRSLVIQLQGMVGGATVAAPLSSAAAKRSAKAQSAPKPLRSVPGTAKPPTASGGAVGPKKPRIAAKPLAEPAAAGKDPFPLDEDFREF